MNFKNNKNKNKNKNFFFFKNLKDKKGLTPVVAVTLLLFLVIVGFLAFQKWYLNYENSLLVEYEQRSKQDMTNSKIVKVIGDKLYFRTDAKNLKVKKVIVENQSCINDGLVLSQGMNELNFSDCIKDLSGPSRISVITDNYVFEKLVYLGSNYPGGSSGSGGSPNPNSCSFNSLTINNGQSVIAYKNAQETGSQACQSETRTCNSGVLSGTYTYQTCQDEIGSGGGSNPNPNYNSCTFHSQTINHGNSVIAYKNSQETSPNTCQKESRICNDGVLSGSFAYKNCEVLAPSLISSFYKILDYSYHNYVLDTINTSDNGYLSVGYTYEYSNMEKNNFNYDLLLIKYDVDSKIEWVKTFGGSENDYGHSVIEDKNGDFVVVGYTDSYGSGYYDIMVVKFSKTGDVKWMKTFGGSKNDYGRSVIEVSTGGYLIGGYGYFKSGNDNTQKNFILKITENGVLDWMRVIKGVDKNFHNYANSLIETSNNEFVVGGYGVLKDRYHDIFLVKFNSQGTKIWSKYFGYISKHDIISDLIKTSDGGIIIGGKTAGVGGSNYDSLIIKINAQGDIVWDKILNGGVYNDELMSIAKSKNGGYIFTGYTQKYYSNSNYDIYLLKLQEQGNCDYLKIIDDNFYKYPQSILETKDNRLVLGGYSLNQYGACYDSFLLKINLSESCEECDYLKTISSCDIEDISIPHGSINLEVFSFSPNVSTFNFNSKNSFINPKSIFINGASKSCQFNGKQVKHGEKVKAFYTQEADSNGHCKEEERLCENGFLKGSYIYSSCKAGFSSFFKVNDWSRTEDIFDTIKTNDSGFLSVGTTNSYGAGNEDILLIKYNSNGSVLWTKIIGGGSYDYGKSVIEEKNGDFVVVGHTNSYGSGGYDIILIKLDKTGKVLKTRTFGRSYNEEGIGIAKVFGGYVISGNTEGYRNKNSHRKNFILKVDNNFNIVWMRSIYSPYGDLNLKSMELLSDGGFLFTGSGIRTNGVNKRSIYVFKISADGQLLVSKAIGLDTKEDYGADVISTRDYGFLVTGFSKSYGGEDQDIFFSKYNFKGERVWSKVLNNANVAKDDVPYSIIESSDGGVVIVGKTKDYGSQNYDNIFGLKISESGLVDWMRTVKGSNNNLARKVIQTSDNGFVITGYTTSIGGNDQDAFILKLDENGNCNNCQEIESHFVSISDISYSNKGFGWSNFNCTTSIRDYNLNSISRSQTENVVFSNK